MNIQILQEEIEDLKRQWMVVRSLSKEILEQSDYSDYFDSHLQRWERTRNTEWELINEKTKSSRSQASLLRFYIKGQFEFWETRIDIWTELFWLRAQELGIAHNRREPLRKLLARGRFSSYEAMFTRYQWPRLICSGILQQRYTAAEVDAVEKIIASDEFKRLDLLKKCLRLKRVADSDYLSYGAALDYFTRGKFFEGIEGSLLQKHFSREEIETLNSIWK